MQPTVEPITFKDAMLKTMVARGLTKEEANACYAESLPKLHGHNVQMMDEKIATYPHHTIMWGLWVSLRGYALDWIEAHRPDLLEEFQRD